MQQNPYSAPDSFSPAQPEPKKSNKGLIIAIVVVLVLCCCCVGIGCLWWLYQNGDSLMKSGGTSLLLNLL
jgi:flagellar basal body-associated protein FliL